MQMMPIETHTGPGSLGSGMLIGTIIIVPIAGMPSAFNLQSITGTTVFVIALCFGREAKRGRVRALGILEL